MQNKSTPESSLVQAFAYSLILLSAIVETCSCAGMSVKASNGSVGHFYQQTAASNNMDWGGSLRAQLLNLTFDQLREANRQHPLGNMSNQNPQAALHYRHSAMDSRDPAVWLHKRTLIEDPSLSRVDPKYMDACNSRARATMQEQLSPASHHSVHQRSSKYGGGINDGIGQLVMAMRTMKYSQDSAPKRTRRAVVSYEDSGSSSSYQALLDPHSKEEKNLVHFRSPKGYSTATAAADAATTTKRTSFVLSGGKLSSARSHRAPASNHNNNKWPNHSAPGATNKNRYLYAPHGGQMGAPIAGPTKQPPSWPTVQGDHLMRELKNLDLRTTWHINCLRNTINHIRSMPASYISQIDRELARGLSASEETKRKINAQLRAWMPSVESLLGNRTTSSMARTHQQDSSRALMNMSHRLQYFNLILEQMVFEQKATERKFVAIYCDMEKLLLKVLCDMENLVPMLAGLEEAFERAKQREAMIGSDQQDRQFLRSIERRFKHSRGPVESPFERLPGARQLLKRIGHELFITRDVMPLEQRLKAGSAERMLRDRLVFEDLSSFLAHLDSILAEISV